jgi:hypothetical protein
MAQQSILANRQRHRSVEEQAQACLLARQRDFPGMRDEVGLLCGEPEFQVLRAGRNHEGLQGVEV